MGAAALFALVDAESGLRNWWQLRGDLEAAQQRIAALRADVDGHRAASASLEADEFAIERAIRERLEYAKPGETLVRLGDTDSLSYRIR